MEVSASVSGQKYLFRFLYNAPDIYVPNFLEICDEYTRRRKALFIPECATHSYAGPRLVYGDEVQMLQYDTPTLLRVKQFAYGAM